MGENEMTFKQKLRHYLNLTWNFCVNQFKKIIDMINLTEHCMKTDRQMKDYTLISMPVNYYKRDEETQTDDIHQSPKRKRAKLAKLLRYSEVFDDDDNDDDRSGKFSTNYSADISEFEVTPEVSPTLKTWPRSVSLPD